MRPYAFLGSCAEAKPWHGRDVWVRAVWAVWAVWAMWAMRHARHLSDPCFAEQRGSANWILIMAVSSTSTISTSTISSGQNGGWGGHVLLAAKQLASLDDLFFYSLSVICRRFRGVRSERKWGILVLCLSLALESLQA